MARCWRGGDVVGGLNWGETVMQSREEVGRNNASAAVVRIRIKALLPAEPAKQVERQAYRGLAESGLVQMKADGGRG